MKLRNLELIWVAFVLSLLFFNILFERLNNIKGGGDIKIYVILLILIYSLVFFLFLSFEEYYSNINLICIIFTIILGLSAFNQIFEKYKLNEDAYILYSFVLFVLVYANELFYKK